MFIMLSIVHGSKCFISLQVYLNDLIFHTSSNLFRWSYLSIENDLIFILTCIWQYCKSEHMRRGGGCTINLCKNYRKFSKNFRKSWGMVGNFKMILHNDKTKFWYMVWTKMILWSWCIHPYNIYQWEMIELWKKFPPTS